MRAAAQRLAAVKNEKDSVGTPGEEIFPVYFLAGEQTQKPKNHPVRNRMRGDARGDRVNKSGAFFIYFQ